MKILITNDDGLHCDGIDALIKLAKPLGELTVVAPMYEQSGKSHAIEIKKPFAVAKTQLDGGLTAYAIDSTPADCVRFAIVALGKQFDLVLSGINCGFNLGKDILYSGTAGAAFEAAAYGIKAAAISTFPGGTQTAADALPDIYKTFAERDLFSLADIYNINIPENCKGVRFTKQGGPYYRDRFIDLNDGRYVQQGYCVHTDAGDMTLDTDAVVNGYISITPLTTERTDMKAFEKLK